MSEDNGNSAAAVSAAHIPTEPRWKAPHTVADTQHPIKLETAEFDSSFIPYEIEYTGINLEFFENKHSNIIAFYLGREMF